MEDHEFDDFWGEDEATQSRYHEEAHNTATTVATQLDKEEGEDLVADHLLGHSYAVRKREGTKGLTMPEALHLLTSSLRWEESVDRIVQLQKGGVRLFLKALMARWSARFPSGSVSGGEGTDDGDDAKANIGKKRDRRRDGSPLLPSLLPSEVFPSLVDDTIEFLWASCNTHHSASTCPVAGGDSGATTEACRCQPMAGQTFFHISAYSLLRTAVERRVPSLADAKPPYRIPQPPPQASACCLRNGTTFAISLPLIAIAAVTHVLEMRYGVYISPSIFFQQQREATLECRIPQDADRGTSPPTHHGRHNQVQEALLWIRSHSSLIPAWSRLLSHDSGHPPTSLRLSFGLRALHHWGTQMLHRWHLRELLRAADMLVVGESHDSLSLDREVDVLTDSRALYRDLSFKMMASETVLCGEEALPIFAEKEHRLVWLCVFHASIRSASNSKSDVAMNASPPQTSYPDINSDNSGRTPYGKMIQSTSRVPHQALHDRLEAGVAEGSSFFLDWCDGVVDAVGRVGRLGKLAKESCWGISLTPPGYQGVRRKITYVEDLLAAYYKVTTASPPPPPSSGGSPVMACGCFLCKSIDSANTIHKKRTQNTPVSNPRGPSSALMRRAMASELIRALGKPSRRPNGSKTSHSAAVSSATRSVAQPMQATAHPGSREVDGEDELLLLETMTHCWSRPSIERGSSLLGEYSDVVMIPLTGRTDDSFESERASLQGHLALDTEIGFKHQLLQANCKA